MLEVLTTVIFFLFFITLSLPIEKKISIYRNEPKAVNMNTDEHKPMKEELTLLL